MRLKLLVLLKNVKIWAYKFFITDNKFAEVEERFYFGKVEKRESNKE